MQKWKIAQEHEKRYWSEIKRKCVALPEPSVDYFRKIFSLSQKNELEGKLLDVGSGPKGGILNFMPHNKVKVAIDSLFGTDSTETEADISPVSAIAENLPIRGESFDVVFCVNALDHMANPQLALREIFRVCRKTLILMVHVVPSKRKAVHRLLVLSRNKELSKLLSVISRLRILSKLLNENISVIMSDGRGHPHYFTSKDVIDLVSQTGFSIKRLKITPDKFYHELKMDLFAIVEKRNRV